jgi:acyl-CoA synthetase (AMP-forming)/AMP-acid ligase II
METRADVPKSTNVVMSLQNSLTALLDAAASERGAEVSIIEAHRTWTPKQLLERADVVATSLQGSGVQAGDRVVVRGRNSGDLVARIFGAWKLGAIAVPIHAQVGADRFTRIVADAMPSVYLADDSPGEPGSESALPAYTTAMLSSADSPTLEVIRARSTPPPQIESRTSVALLMYTSGSTAAPLGVICTEAPILFALNAIHSELAYNERDRVLCVLPLAFDYGLYQILLTLKGGAVLVLEDGVQRPHRIPRVLAEQAISVFPGMPSMFGPLLRAGWLSGADQPSLRMLTSTGEFFPPPLIDSLRCRLPAARVVPMYGMTECKRVSIQAANAPETARYSTGRALGGTEAWVGDSQGSRKPPGQEGELFVRGPHLMAGYWQNQVATAVRYKEIDGKRTIQTGDIFRMDEAGHLSFVRREGGFLKVKGHRLSPAEIEACLLALPEVWEAVAVGYTNSQREDSLAVFITSDSSDHAGLRARARQQCSLHLHHAAVPSLVHIINGSLPRSPNGKYDRPALTSRAQELDSR